MNPEKVAVPFLKNKIAALTGTGSFTTIDGCMIVEGQAMGPVEKVEWCIVGRESVTVDGTVNWTIQNLLLDRCKKLAVKATGEG